MMLEVLLENAADSLGLSKAQIIMACVYILTILVLLVFFILLTIGAWNNESSFNALVQGTLISGACKAVTDRCLAHARIAHDRDPERDGA